MSNGFSSKAFQFSAKLGAKRAGVFVMMVACVTTFLFPSATFATAVKGYDGTVSEKNLTLDLSVGEVKTVILTYTNTGTATWTKGAKTGQVSLFVADGSSAELRDASWLSAEVPGTLRDANVAPKKSTTVTFKVKATKVGTFTETLRLAAQNTAWMRGTDTALVVNVRPKGETAPVATATVYKGYAGTVNQSNLAFDMNVGDTKSVTLTYTNTGTKTWTSGIKTGQVALFLADPTASALKDTSWLGADAPGKLSDAEVTTGKKTTVSFKFLATKVGTYTETYRLAAQNTAWMRGTETKFIVTVHAKGTTTPVVTTPVSTGSTTDSSSTPQAILLLRSSNSKDLKMAGGDTAIVTLGFKNAGTSPWSNYLLRLSSVQTALDSSTISSYVRDASWQSPTDAVVQNIATNPGEIGFLTFTLKAPPKRGTYTVRFALVADGKQVENAFVDIPITVTSDSAYDLPPVSSTPVDSGSTSTIGDIPNASTFSDTEPILRVGLFATTDDRMQVRGVSTPYEVRQGTNVICSMKGSDILTVSYDRSNHVYRLDGDGCVGQSTDPYRVVASAGDWSPLEMADFNRPVSWLPGANDNTFRGVLELRYTPATDKVWVINELPIEYYLRGLAETSDVSPIEFQKALLTAARTYAYYHWTRGTKHEEEFYTVDAKFDQVYRGYGAEARSPKIVQGVNETRGQIVTYNGSLAITPYFSRSDGRTRSWGEVWAGGSQYPWLVTVPVPEDAGKTLWGHGVGMSASGALGMANDGKGYREILQHFYTGTGLMRFY